MDFGLGGVVLTPGVIAFVKREVNVGVGGQAVHFGLAHVMNPVRCRVMPGRFFVNRDAGLGRPVGIAGLVLAELGAGTRLQAEQFGAYEAAAVAWQAVQRGAGERLGLVV